MRTTKTHSIYPVILLAATGLAYEHNGSQTISGDDFTEPVYGITVFYRRTFQNGSRKIEINVTTPKARPTFEWLAEITIDDKSDGTYKHFLVRPTDIVETYGKSVIDVEPNTAKSLAAELQQLQ